ncbi:MAG: hypothetical protein ACTHLE_01275 [Agriterribacter sp.]
MKLHITCKEAVDYISKKEEKKLSVLQRLQLMRHLAICSLCRLFAKQNKTITEALSKTHHEQEHHLTPEEKERIINAMEKQKDQ